MRILFLSNQWHLRQTPCRTVGVHPELVGGRHEWVRALAAPGAGTGDVYFDLSRDTLADLLARVPGGTPDAMVVWEPGYQGLPEGIEEAPFPVVACYSDWNLVMPQQAGMLDAYDYLFTDRRGVRVLNSMGIERAEFWPMWGHDPDFSTYQPGVERVWDIGMVGNLNRDVQRERAGWLARVAALGDRYRVRIAGGVYGEEYTRMINATKITFNRSIRGEMNMRCFEAAASGSLLFYEEENEEIREFLEDRLHCVLYNDRNLEELLAYYLENDSEREQITAAARERVAEFSFPRNLNRLADRLEALELPARVAQRPIYPVSLPELNARHARQAAGTMSLGSEDLALRLCRDAHEADPNDAGALNDLAVACSLQVARSTDAKRRSEMTGEALTHMLRAVELCPSSAFYCLNLAQMYSSAESHEAAFELAQHALALLDGGGEDPAPALCLPFPLEWNEYRVQAAGVYNQTRSEPESFPLQRRLLLLHRAGTLLAALAEKQGVPELGTLGYQVAVTARPDLGSSRAALARLLAEQGAIDEALEHLQAALTTDPLLVEAWPLYALLLRERGGDEATQLFMRRAFTVLDAVAPPQERWAASGAVMDLERARETLTALAREWGLPAPGAPAETAAPGAEQPEAYVIACLLRGDWELALDALGGLGAAQGYAPFLAAAGARLLRERRAEPASRVATVAVQMDPESAAAWRVLGTALLSLGHAERGEAALLEAVKLDPEETGARHELIELYLRQNRLLEAVPHAAVAVTGGTQAVRESLRRLKKAVEKNYPAEHPAAQELRRLLSESHPAGGGADAVPVSLSLCLITKNEAANLPRVLRSVRGLATEIIVVDTGSTDDTVRVAQRLGARVSHFPWIDDFAAARNASLAEATGEWILVLDADDEFPSESIGTVRNYLARDPDAEVVGLYRRYPHASMQRDSVSVQPRLFRNGRGFHFEGAIHEQVVSADGSVAAPDVTLPVTIHHHTGEGKGRRERNLRILRQRAERDVRTRFYLGLTLYEAEEWAEAARHLSTVVEACDDRPDFLAKAYGCLANSLLKQGLKSEAERVLVAGLRRFPTHPELCFCLGLARWEMGKPREAQQAFEAALTGRFGASLNWHDWACREHKPHLALAELHLALGDGERALQHLDAAIRFTGTRPQLERFRQAILTKTGRITHPTPAMPARATAAGLLQPDSRGQLSPSRPDARKLLRR